MFSLIATWFGYVGMCMVAPDATCRPFLAFLALAAAAAVALTLVLMAYKAAREREVQEIEGARGCGPCKPDLARDLFRSIEISKRGTLGMAKGAGT